MGSNHHKKRKILKILNFNFDLGSNPLDRRDKMIFRERNYTLKRAIFIYLLFEFLILYKIVVLSFHQV